MDISTCFSDTSNWVAVVLQGFPEAHGVKKTTVSRISGTATAHVF